jgi:phosphatidylserine decarboxylase
MPGERLWPLGDWSWTGVAGREVGAALEQTSKSGSRRLCSALRLNHALDKNKFGNKTLTHFKRKARRVLPPNLLDDILVPIHPAGWPFIAVFAAATAILAFIAQPLGWIGAALTTWCVFFFRNPDRVTPCRAGLIVSPADGIVKSIGPATPPPELELGPAARNRVSVFMNVFDVHVNRIPLDGVIARLNYRPGRFFNASLDKASEHNERQGVVITTPDGTEVGLVQIAGLVARRILCRLTIGEAVRTGQRFGMIRFGSRVDVYLPPGATALVAVGQRMIAGETVIADLQSDEPERPGARR